MRFHLGASRSGLPLDDFDSTHTLTPNPHFAHARHVTHDTDTEHDFRVNPPTDCMDRILGILSFFQRPAIADTHMIFVTPRRHLHMANKTSNTVSHQQDPPCVQAPRPTCSQAYVFILCSRNVYRNHSDHIVVRACIHQTNGGEVNSLSASINLLILLFPSIVAGAPTWRRLLLWL